MTVDWVLCLAGWLRVSGMSVTPESGGRPHVGAARNTVRPVPDGQFGGQFGAVKRPSVELAGAVEWFTRLGCLRTSA